MVKDGFTGSDTITDMPMSSASGSSSGGNVDYALKYSELLEKYTLLESKCKELVTAYNSALSQMDGLGFAILQFARNNKLELEKQQSQQQIPKTNTEPPTTKE